MSLMKKSTFWQSSGSARNIAIFDMDGTLCDFTHRKHLLRAPGEHHTGADWEAFNLESIKDPVKRDIRLLLMMMHYHAMTIVIMTGRSARYADLTTQWLKREEVPCDLLLMRAIGDNRSDVDVKMDLYKEHVQGNGRVHFVLEDRDKVVEMWRGLGLTCLQVMKGEY